MSALVNQALSECIRHPTDGAVARLRSLLQFKLISTLSIVSSDGHAIREAIDETFRLFANHARVASSRNWLAWIAATALGQLVQIAGLLSWVDRFRPQTSVADQHERRALVFLMLLTLDGPCRWHLLRLARGEVPSAQAAACERKLIDRLASM